LSFSLKNSLIRIIQISLFKKNKINRRYKFLTLFLGFVFINSYATENLTSGDYLINQNISDSNFPAIQVAGPTIGTVTFNSGITILGSGNSGFTDAGQRGVSGGISFINDGTSGAQTVTTLNNFGNILGGGTLASPTGDAISLWPNGGVGATIGTLNNNGNIKGTYGILLVNSASINQLTNYSNALIFGQQDAFHVQGGTTITSLTNLGTISAGRYDIYNTGTITTLNNAQGVGNSEGALSIYRVLPVNYNVIINSSSYGQLIMSTGTLGGALGSPRFGIYQGSNITSLKYTNVLQNIAAANVDLARTGTYDNMNWTLALQDGSLVNWDLTFSGISSAQTQISVAIQAQRLRSTFNSSFASSNFANMNGYDCNLFDQNNMCISAGGRYTNIDNPSSNHSAALVVLGYKVNSNIRMGGFLDQNINNNTPTGINVSNKNPMMGAFVVWNKNTDGLGFQVKLANAYQDKDITTTRDAVATSEAGTGKTNLNTQSYIGELSYAFNYRDLTIVRPYFALRYTNIKQDAYTEDSTVSTPLSYAKLGDRSTSALLGVKLNHSLTPRTNLTASLGVEQDINHQVDKLTATGVADLTSENFNNNIKRTRPVASAGAYYAVAKNQRLSGEVYYQQLPFQSTGSATAYFNYMIGF
jgi:uncharacterized protein YhjY with autotransporter beta-barrel domain